MFFPVFLRNILFRYFSGKYNKFILCIENWFFQAGVKTFIIYKIYYFAVIIRNILGRILFFGVAQ